MGSLVQDYFLETLEERDYFGRYQRYMLKEVFSTHAHGIFPPLSANALSRLFLHITGAKRKPSGTRLGGLNSFHQFYHIEL